MKVQRCKRTSYGNIILELTNTDDVNTVVKEWKPHFFGNPDHPNEKTSASKMSSKPHKPRDGIIYVETTITEYDLVKTLEESGFRGASCSRFKKGNTLLTTVKVTFKSADDLEIALKDGIFHGYRFLPVVEYRRRPMQCYKCNKFGHPMKWCRSSRSCGSCASEDKSHGPDTACPVKNTPNKHTCSNCKGNHGARATICPTYKERLSLMSPTQHHHGY